MVTHKDRYIIFDTDIQIINNSLKGYHVAKFYGGECACFASGNDTNVSYKNGKIITSIATYYIDANSIDLSSLQDSNYPKKILIYVDKDDGQVKAVGGTAARPIEANKTGRFTKQPKPPDYESDITEGCVVLAEVWLRKSGNNIQIGDVTDRRQKIKMKPEDFHEIGIDHFAGEDWEGSSGVSFPLAYNETAIARMPVHGYYVMKMVSTDGVEETAERTWSDRYIDLAEYHLAFWFFLSGTSTSYYDIDSVTIELQVDNDWNKKIVWVNLNILAGSSAITCYNDDHWLKIAITGADLLLPHYAPDYTGVPAGTITYVGLTTPEDDIRHITGIRMKLLSKAGRTATVYFDNFVKIPIAEKGACTFTLDDTVSSGINDLDNFGIPSVSCGNMLEVGESLPIIKQAGREGNEVINHGSNHIYWHSATDDQMKDDVVKGFTALIEANEPGMARWFAYPGGAYGRTTFHEEMNRFIKRYCVGARATGAPFNAIPPADWYRLKAFRIDGADMTLDELKAICKLADHYGTWAIFYGHGSMMDLTAFADWAIKNDINIVTFSEMFDEVIPNMMRIQGTGLRPLFKTIFHTDSFSCFPGNGTELLNAQYGFYTPRHFDAAIEDDGTIMTDYTTALGESTENDVEAFSPAYQTDDAFYFGDNEKFSKVWLKIYTAKAQTNYVRNIVWEYWNGAWVSLTGLSGTAEQMDSSGSDWKDLAFTEPGDWATTTVNSQGPYYYIRARMTKSYDHADLDYCYHYDDSLTTYTDLTTEFNDATTQDIDIWNPPENNDYIYFGNATTFQVLALQLKSTLTGGKGTAFTWQYWNGSTWATMPSFLEDGFWDWTNCDYEDSELPNYNEWSALSGWAQTSVNGTNAYWIRCLNTQDQRSGTTIGDIGGIGDIPWTDGPVKLTEAYFGEEIPDDTYKEISLSTDPQFPGAMLVTVTNVSSPTGDVIIYGYDLWGDYIEETITISAGASIMGDVPFYELIKIRIPDTITDADDVSLGMSQKVGLSYHGIIGKDIHSVINNGVKQTLTWDRRHNTVDVGTIVDGTDVTISYKARVSYRDRGAVVNHPGQEMP